MVKKTASNVTIDSLLVVRLLVRLHQSYTVACSLHRVDQLLWPVVDDDHDESDTETELKGIIYDRHSPTAAEVAVVAAADKHRGNKYFKTRQNSNSIFRIIT